jgi:hypothetical protein
VLVADDFKPEWDLINREDNDAPEPERDITPLPNRDNQDRPVNKVIFEECFWGNVSSDVAKVMLMGQPIGTYLTRWSQQQPKYCISVRVKKPDDVKHFIISEDSRRGYAIDKRDKWFKSREELLEYYAGKGRFLNSLKRENMNTESEADDHQV